MMISYGQYVFFDEYDDHDDDEYKVHDHRRFRVVRLGKQGWWWQARWREGEGLARRGNSSAQDHHDDDEDGDSTTTATSSG